MHWDRPSAIQQSAHTSDAIRVDSERTPARQDSDAFAPIGPAKVSPIARVWGFTAPSSWVVMTAAMWWAWRLVAAFARGELSGAHAQPVAVISGLVADLVFTQLVFTLTRVTAVATTPNADLSHPYVHFVKRTVFLLFFTSTLFRILDVVQSAMVQRPPDVEFWQAVLRDPSILLSGPSFGAVLVAVAATAIGRYALGCDLEITQSLAEYWDQRKAITLTTTSAGVCAVLALGMATGSPYGGRGRLVEVGAPGALLQALADRAASSRPTLDK